MGRSSANIGERSTSAAEGVPAVSGTTTTVDVRRGADRAVTTAPGIETRTRSPSGTTTSRATPTTDCCSRTTRTASPPAPGYDTHAHRDTEIVTWVLAGVPRPRRLRGPRGELRAGSVQRVSAGRGHRALRAPRRHRPRTPPSCTWCRCGCSPTRPAPPRPRTARSLGVAGRGRPRDGRVGDGPRRRRPRRAASGSRRPPCTWPVPRPGASSTSPTRRTCTSTSPAAPRR